MTVVTTADWSKTDLWGPPRPRRSFGAVHASWGVLWFVVAQVLAAAAVLASAWVDPNLGVDVASSGPVVVGGMLALWAVFVGYPLWVCRFRGTRSLAVDFRLARPSVTQMLAGAGLGLALRAASIGGGILAARLGMTVGDNASWLTSGYTRGVLVFLVVGTCLIGPFAEELFYRGLLLSALLRWHSVPERARTLVAVAVSSLAFGLSHATGASAGAGYVVGQTAAIGALFAVLALGRRWGLATSSAAHVVFNTTGVLLMFLGVAS